MSNYNEKDTQGIHDPVSPRHSPHTGDFSSNNNSAKDELATEHGNYVDDDAESSKTHQGREAVTRVEAINDVLSSMGVRNFFSLRIEPFKIFLLFLLFLQGYTSGLDGIMSGSWQTFAGNQFGQSAQTGSINTIKAVIAAAVLVPYARLSDKIGRVECWLIATVMFTIGRIVTASTPNFGGLFAGTIIWQFGYAGFRILATALTSDLSQLRDRTFFMNIYLMPIIINLWISGDIVQKLISRATWYWRWGYGIFGIIVPVVTLVFSVPYFTAQMVARRRKTLPPLQLKKPGESFKSAAYNLFMDLDVVGIHLFAASLVLVLLPLTLAGGASTKWRRGYIIAMICIGGGLIPFFLLWELKYARAPFIPRKRLESTFYAAMALEFFWRLALSVELNYVRYVLLVAFDQTPKSAQRLGQLYDFMQACTNVVVGIILHFWPHPKVFVVAGSLIGLLGMGLLYKYRVAYDGISGFIAADVLVGLGGGMMRFPKWTLVHAGIPHDQMAVATGFMMTMYQVGAAVGSCVGTAVWTQKLAPELIKRLGPTVGMQVYKSPLNFLKRYPLGTPTRDAILDAYSHVQRLLIIVSISFAALCVLLTLGLRNYTVGDKQSLTDEEREAERRKIKEGKLRWLKWVVGY